MKPLAARVAGIVRAPRVTFADLCTVSRSPWVDALALSTLLIFASLAALLSTSVGQIALVDQWERTAVAFGQPVDDALYLQFQELSTHWLAYSAGIAVLTGPLLVGVITGIVILGLRFAGQRPRATTVLSLVAHASLILGFRQLIAAPVNYVGESLASPTTFVQLLASVDETSPLARFLGVVDIFIVWWAVILAVGVATVAHRRVRPVALAFTGVYLAIALLLALAMAATGGTA